MSDEEVAGKTREERIKRFSEMTDDEQDSALEWFDRMTTVELRRYRAVADLLYERELSQSSKGFLLGLLQPTILTSLAMVFEERDALDNLRGSARYEAEKLGYNWKARRSRRKHIDLHRDDLDYYGEILRTETRPAPAITEYVEALRKAYGE